MYDIAKEERKRRIALVVMFSAQAAMAIGIVIIGVWKLT